MKIMQEIVSYRASVTYKFERYLEMLESAI